MKLIRCIHIFCKENLYLFFHLFFLRNKICSRIVFPISIETKKSYDKIPRKPKWTNWKHWTAKPRTYWTIWNTFWVCCTMQLIVKIITCVWSHLWGSTRYSILNYYIIFILCTIFLIFSAVSCFDGGRRFFQSFPVHSILPLNRFFNVA